MQAKKSTTSMPLRICICNKTLSNHESVTSISEPLYHYGGKPKLQFRDYRSCMYNRSKDDLYWNVMEFPSRHTLIRTTIEQIAVDKDF